MKLNLIPKLEIDNPAVTCCMFYVVTPILVSLLGKEIHYCAGVFGSLMCKTNPSQITCQISDHASFC